MVQKEHRKETVARVQELMQELLGGTVESEMIREDYDDDARDDEFDAEEEDFSY